MGMHGTQRPWGGERAAPDHFAAPPDGATLSAAPFPSLISPALPFCSMLPLPPRRYAPCSHSRSRPRFCSGRQRSTGTTGSHHQISLGFEGIFMWTYRWNQSLQSGDVGLGFPCYSTCELLQIMVSVLGYDAGVYRRCRDLGPWCDHGDFHKA
jgi:hypothetical protein